MSDWLREQRSHIHPVVFSVSAVVIILFVVFGAVFTETAGDWLGAVFDFITGNLGWFFITSAAIFLLFCLYLAIGPYAHVRLGPDDSRPDYTYLTWFAMLFSAGMGIGLVFWGVAEPIFHYADAPRVASETPEAAREAMILTYNHWGLLPWAIYAVLGMSLGYFGFRHGLPLTVRSALYPLIGDRMNGWLGNLVDILAILGTMFGIATSLGLGVMEINAGLGFVFDTPVAVGVQLLLIGIITAVATVSVSIALAIGTTLGILAGYVGGLLDEVIGRILDVFFSFPGLLLAITVAAVLGTQEAVARACPRAYGTPVVITDSTLARRTITAWFSDWSHEDVMFAFCAVVNDLRGNWQEDKRWEPRMDAERRDEHYRLWKKAVTRTFDWVD
jgi:choline/glycine/proline betaine transport protein